jgi:hypothetical protein
MSPLQNLGLNPYDLRKPCDRSPDKDGDLCYSQMNWIDEWMNKQEVRDALGIPSGKEFHSKSYIPSLFLCWSYFFLFLAGYWV